MFFGVWWRSVSGMPNVDGESLLHQTSALHLLEVRSTPLLIRMMPSMAWGVAEPAYRS
jgi:hypothetical protein